MNAVKLEILTGRALVNGAEIALCPAQRLLVCALARCRHSVPREQLEALLWPDDDATRARNLLNIALHRLRKRLGDAAVVQSAEGYRLGDSVVLDLWQIEALAAQLRASPAPDLATTARWLPVVRRVCCGCARSASDPEFVGILERRMQTAARDVTNRLAEHALAHQHAAVALALVRVTLDFDACDESARDSDPCAPRARGSSRRDSRVSRLHESAHRRPRARSVLRAGLARRLTP